MTDSTASAVDAALLMNQLITVVEAVREMREAQTLWGPYRETAQGQETIEWHERNVDRLLVELVPPDKVLSYWLRGASTVVQRIMDGYSERERELMQNLLESNQWIARANYYLGPPMPAADGSRQEFHAVALERLRDLALLRQLAIESFRGPDEQARRAASVRLGELIDRLKSEGPWPPVTEHAGNG